MQTIGARELQQRASAALRRVERGETLDITERGRLVAMLVPPSSATGESTLMAAGRVLPARGLMKALPAPVVAGGPSADVLAEGRSDR